MRWSDQDVYGHVNHARLVTLLEDARVALIFTEAGQRGAGALADGVLVAKLAVDYRAQIPYQPRPLRVELWAHQVRAASFLLDYAVYAGYADGATPAVTARTQMVPFDLAAGRPRRLQPVEREFLARWCDGGGEAGESWRGG